MKRVKLMLLSLSVLAVVGGALAFTAKNTQFFCTAPTDNGSCNHACPSEKRLAVTDPGNFICTTVTIDDLDPNKSTDCQYTDGAFTDCGLVSVNSTIE